jgi:hypothetical protein
VARLDDHCRRSLLPPSPDVAGRSLQVGTFGPFVTQIVARYATPARAQAAVRRARAITLACRRWTGATPGGAAVPWQTRLVDPIPGLRVSVVQASAATRGGAAIPTRIDYAVMAAGRLASVVQHIRVGGRPDPAVTRAAFRTAAARLRAAGG